MPKSKKNITETKDEISSLCLQIKTLVASDCAKNLACKRITRYIDEITEKYVGKLQTKTDIITPKYNEVVKLDR